MRAKLWSFVKALLFRLDAETAHHLTIRLIRLGIAFGKVPLRIAAGSVPESEGEPPRVLGMTFRSRVGLAAGFDKNAEVLTGLPALGFGFAEIGTVTPRPQPGNERPRLFRDASRLALFNRMGFNGLGAEIVSGNVRAARESLPEGFRVGVNVGKNKDTPNEDAASDYAKAAAAFEGLCDYLVINVSSPNTPGLRSLQTTEALNPIVGGVNEVISRWAQRPPLLLKLAPELLDSDLTQVIEAVEGWGIDGWVLTNTLGGTWTLPDGKELPGGWSGAPVAQAAFQSLATARGATKRPIISVGGIMSAADAEARLRAGADLVQLYSGWIYRGPAFPVEVSCRLLESRLD